jgi:putative spermidine/putrescine transport system ATP-binding protein
MSQFIEIRHVVKRFGANTVLRDISLGVDKSEMVTLLGPSGCGKSTLLRAIAGLNDVDAGQVFIDGQDVTQVDVRKRRVGMVFQSYALFPNMTAAQNVGFGLSIEKRPKAEIETRVKEMIDLVGLQGKEDQRPSQLSGGQQQRVALARALIMKPKVLLLDEPLSALDAQIRQSLRVQIRDIQQKMQMTAIFVTHDQEEAMSISDRVFVMHDGVIAQQGTPNQIYISPNSEFVARFIGHYNVLRPESAAKIFSIDPPACKVIAVRPEAISLTATPDALSFKGRITQSSMLGSIIRYHVDCEGQSMTFETVNQNAKPLRIGDTVPFYLGCKDLLLIQD